MKIFSYTLKVATPPFQVHICDYSLLFVLHSFKFNILGCCTIFKDVTFEDGENSWQINLLK